MSIDLSAKKKRSRISKLTIMNREFVCECGSAYLSRGALTNHKKQKHNSNSLENLSQDFSKTLHRKRREVKRTKVAKTQELKIQEHKKIMRQYFNAIPASQGYEYYNCVNSFPKHLFSSEAMYIEFLESLERVEKMIALKRLEKGERPIVDIVLELEGLHNFNMWDTLALYCCYISESINQQFYQETAVLIVGFGLAAQSQHSRDIDNNSGDFGHNTHNSELGHNVKPDQLPEYANSFLMDYYVPLVSEEGVLKEEAELMFFGTEDVHIFRAFIIMYLLCKWLNVYRFTKLKLDKFK